MTSAAHTTRRCWCGIDLPARQLSDTCTTAHGWAAQRRRPTQPTALHEPVACVSGCGGTAEQRILWQHDLCGRCARYLYGVCLRKHRHDDRPPPTHGFDGHLMHSYRCPICDGYHHSHRVHGDSEDGPADFLGLFAFAPLPRAREPYSPMSVLGFYAAEMRAPRMAGPQ